MEIVGGGMNAFYCAPLMRMQSRRSKSMKRLSLVFLCEVIKLKDIDELIFEFSHGQLAIDYLEASEDQIEKLDEVLSEGIRTRPHDDLSFAEHMRKYLPQGFCFLVCDEICASSFKKTVENCRPRIVTIEEFLEAAVGKTQDNGISEADFDSLF